MVAENGSDASAGAADGVSTAAIPSGYINRDELLSLRVVAGQKRIFLALCENARGRYLKMSDRRSKLIVPGSGIPDLRAAIDALHAVVEERAPDPVSSSNDEAASAPGSASSAPVLSPAPAAAPTTEQVPTSPESSVRAPRSMPQEPLASERFISEGRKFYLDLLENDRGIYVKMSQATTRRISMSFPATALQHLRNAMTQLEELAPPDPAVLNASLTGHHTRTVERQTPTANGSTVTIKAVQRELRVEGKRVVFESGANRRGSYLRITESNAVAKMYVTLPHSVIPQIMNLLKEVQEAGDPLDDLRAAEAAAEGTEAQ